VIHLVGHTACEHAFGPAEAATAHDYQIRLLVLAGLVTTLPLIWFNMAARSLTLTTLGFFQYIAPTLSFSLAVFMFGEPFTQGHAVAFGCIWFALIMVSFESLVRLQRLNSKPAFRTRS